MNYLRDLAHWVHLVFVIGSITKWQKVLSIHKMAALDGSDQPQNTTERETGETKRLLAPESEYQLAGSLLFCKAKCLCYTHVPSSPSKSSSRVTRGSGSFRGKQMERTGV